MVSIPFSAFSFVKKEPEFEKYTVLEDLAGIETVEYNPPPLFLIILMVRVYSDLLEIVRQAFSLEYE